MKKREDHSTRFLLTWMGSSVVVWPVAAFACLILFSASWIVVDMVDGLLALLAPFALLQFLGMLLLGALPGLAIGMVAGSLQHGLLRHHFGVALTGWTSRTIWGSALASCVVVTLALNVPAENVVRYWELAAFPLFIFLASIAQWTLLQRVVQRAWMWVLANAASGVVFVGLMAMNQPSSELVWYPFLQLGLWLLASAAQGAITGIVILWLFDRPRDRWDDDDMEKAPVYLEVYSREPRDRR